MSDDAAIFLHAAGLVESFPLPGGRRRWIVGFPGPAAESTCRGLAREIEARLGHDLSATRCYGVARYTIYHHLAATMARGRVALAGDAAHVISPIGGQGMNLGWHDARDLAEAIASVLRQGDPLEASLGRYSRRARRRAHKVARRADMNTRLGRSTTLPRLRDGLIRALLATPPRHLLARLFMMRGVDSWPV
jgi:2-polyprenyl-6-methoxyphenol hydroxylase-like FAD-dependent oxidoreductase